MKVAIIYYGLFDLEGKERLIGGVETYLVNLAQVCFDLGWEPILFQFAKYNFEKSINGLKVVGVPVVHLSFKQKKRCLYNTAVNYIGDNDIVIFGADHISVSTKRKRCISIQHGIAWDLPVKYLSTNKFCNNKLGAKLKKIKARYDAIKRFENCLNRVCVDYNFLNWYRTFLSDCYKGEIWVVPNFTKIASDIEINSKPTENGAIKIIFARRFVEFRGVKLLAEVANKLLGKYQNIEFTFAGEGPCGNLLNKYFEKEKRVTICKYLPEDSIRIHLKHHIAVIPSLASEGTSLSVAEAMGSGCAIVATSVGGITNMIIDGFNGVLVAPDSGSLYDGLESVITNKEFRQRLSKRAYETAANAFCFSRWKEKWENVLRAVSKQ